MAPSPEVRRRWRRFWLRTHARLDGETADRVIPWLAAALGFAAHLALATAARRSRGGGSGLGPWLQAAWSRSNGAISDPLGGVDPARGSGSLVGEATLQLTRVLSGPEVFTVVQSLAIASAAIPLWRIARDRAALRVGAATTVLVAYALAPTLHRASLTSFHPEVVALPALLWAYLYAERGRWFQYWIAIAVATAARADLGLTVAAFGILVAFQFNRRHGVLTAIAGTAWTTTAYFVVDPSLPTTALTPADEFVARSTAPLAAVGRLASRPWSEVVALVSEPSVLFLVVVLAPLLFFPLVSIRRFLPALPCLVLAMVADRAVQRAAQVGVLNLSPAAAHITPALAFVFVALVFAMERVGTLSVVRVNVDRRVLSALLVASCLFFLTESPSTPYERPWDWGGRDPSVQQRAEMAKVPPQDASIAVSSSATALVAERAVVVELPPSPGDLDATRIEQVAERVEWVLLDTTILDPVSEEPRWRPEDVQEVLRSFAAADFAVAARSGGVYVLAGASASP